MPALGRLSLLILLALVSSVVLILSVLLTNPLTIGPIGVTVWFVIFLMGVAADLALGLYAAKSFLHVHGTIAQRLRYSWRQGLLLGGFITGLLALSSLHQFSFRDAILLGLLLIIIEVYVRFRWP